MRPATVFAGLAGLLSVVMLASGYVIPALLAAVFAVLIFVSRGMSSDRRRHDSDGYVPDTGSAYASPSNDCRDDGGRDAPDRCDSREGDGNDNGDNCDAGGDSGGDGGGD